MEKLDNKIEVGLNDEYYNVGHRKARLFKLKEFVEKYGDLYKKEQDFLEAYTEWFYEGGFSTTTLKYTYYYFVDVDSGAEYSNFASARAMRYDLHTLKTNPYFNKVYVGHRVAKSEEETAKIADKLKAKAMIALKDYWEVVRRIRNNNQTRIQLHTEKDTLKSFIDELIL